LARQWSIRCFHEALLHTKQWRDPQTKVQATIPNSSVVTLTYNEEHLPKDGRLKHNDFQRFMKRLRISRGHEKPVRYFMCGEYGGETSRPHYHAIIFGETFDDRYTEVDASGKITEMSYTLDELWTQKSESGSLSNIGRASVDSFTFAGASYVAGYIAKKLLVPHQTGPITHSVDTTTGEIRVEHPAPEYRQMSRNTGLAKRWILNTANLTRTYADDFVQIQGWKFHPPPYYDQIHKEKRPRAHEKVLEKRAVDSNEAAVEWTSERCAAAQEIALADLTSRSDHF